MGLAITENYGMNLLVAPRGDAIQDVASSFSSLIVQQRRSRERGYFFFGGFHL